MTLVTLIITAPVRIVRWILDGDPHGLRGESPQISGEEVMRDGNATMNWWNQSGGGAF